MVVGARNSSVLQVVLGAKKTTGSASSSRLQKISISFGRLMLLLYMTSIQNAFSVYRCGRCIDPRRTLFLTMYHTDIMCKANRSFDLVHRNLTTDPYLYMYIFSYRRQNCILLSWTRPQKVAWDVSGLCSRGRCLCKLRGREIVNIVCSSYILRFKGESILAKHNNRLYSECMRAMVLIRVCIYSYLFYFVICFL